MPDEGVVRRGDGTELHLTSTEFRLLTDLASINGKVLSREDLLERVWGYDYFGDSRLVDVHIRRLRTKIEPDPANPTSTSSPFEAPATSWFSNARVEVFDFACSSPSVWAPSC